MKSSRGSDIILFLSLFLITLLSQRISLCVYVSFHQTASVFSLNFLVCLLEILLCILNSESLMKTSCILLALGAIALAARPKITDKSGNLLIKLR